MILDYLFNKMTEKNLPEVSAKKCINNKGIPCSRCIDNCPEGAIQLKDKKIKFSEKMCAECGVCRSSCPTQAITFNNAQEEDVLLHACGKKKLVFSCLKESAAGNINMSCLNGMHPEFIAAVLILCADKKIYFNLSRCSDCEAGYNDSFFKQSLEKATAFLKNIGRLPNYEIITENRDIADLIDEEISRRNLFKLVKKESENIVLKTINSIIDDDNNLSARRLLLKAIRDKGLSDRAKNVNTFWADFEVGAACDGCGKCQDVCPGDAWKIEEETLSKRLYYSVANCYQCGLCETMCPQKAIYRCSDGSQVFSSALKKEINLKICSVCGKKHMPENENEEVCIVCRKKELLRKKLSTGLS
ncbi:MULTISPECIES: 4Fe-4S dicluster domain-containing protein [unclassified Sedimentibacter]|uniref:4Fe-4S dicluster domain-containing protein n=1 Tax=unclassified Sedimentibacter TaxID=2649220 RepID=UPI0027DF0FC3|nr:4Fe-4S dicluster domain-containing protein [Sedimentibacter sp. MB35-C1]WMJ75828.1 4Fe-4S dicluster domain-containing protein [Sedimentibacter sp. MB35-C1]